MRFRGCVHSSSLGRWLATAGATGVLTATGLASAHPQFVGEIPNGTTHLCANCHINPAGGGSRNAFGKAFGSKGWSAIKATDTDGDGQTNEQELGDPCGAWKPGKTPARTTDISLPADKNSKAVDPTSPGCGGGGAAGAGSAGGAAGKGQGGDAGGGGAAGDGQGGEAAGGSPAGGHGGAGHGGSAGAGASEGVGAAAGADAGGTTGSDGSQNSAEGGSAGGQALGTDGSQGTAGAGLGSGQGGQAQAAGAAGAQGTDSSMPAEGDDSSGGCAWSTSGTHGPGALFGALALAAAGCFRRRRKSATLR